VSLKSSGPTIKDVARRAGVSVKTVSRVLGGAANVRDETRAHVEQVMEDMEYTPSAAARQLRGQHTGVLAVVSEDVATTPDAIEIVRGIQSVVDERDMILMIGETNGSAAALRRVIDTFRSQRVDAIIRASMSHRELSEGPQVSSIPMVLVNGFEPIDRYITVLPNEREGGRAATQALLSRGHTRIAALTLCEDLVATRLRMHGYREALSAAGIAYDPDLVACASHDGSDDAYGPVAEQVVRLLSLAQPPTAVLAGNDKLAMRLLMELARQGVSVPDEMSVVGYDDYKPISENVRPRLSTVRLPYFEMGRRAARLALDGSDEQRVLVEGRYVSRESAV